MKFQYLVFLAFLVMGISTSAQNDRDFKNFRLPDQRGINDFEAPKDTTDNFDGVDVRIGGASTIQFQAVDHENSGDVELIEIGDNFNLQLPTWT